MMFGEWSTFPLASRVAAASVTATGMRAVGRLRAARGVVQLGRPEHTPGRVLALGHEHLPVGKQRRGAVAACCGGTAKTTAERTAAQVRTRLFQALTIRAPRHVPFEPWLATAWRSARGQVPPTGRVRWLWAAPKLSDALLGR